MAAKKTFLKPVANVAKGDALLDVRQIVNGETGALNYVLVFAEAEVVMPGSWRINAAEFPEGLYEGIFLNAGWRVENGQPRFYLEQA